MIDIRTAIQLLVVVLVVDTATDTQAEEPGADRPEEQQFLDMPKEHREKLREKERVKNLTLGDKKEAPGYIPGYRRSPGIGLSPHAPHLPAAMPAGLSPSFGAPMHPHGRQFRFDFHGYLQPTLRMGFGESAGGDTTLHSAPSVPGGAYGWFDSTNTLPTPWAQLNFICGNEIVSATVVAGAWSTGRADDAAGNIVGYAQQIFAEAYLTYTPDISPFSLEINVGAFPDRYGYMSKWHKGAYGASFIGDIYGTGITGTFMIPFVGNVDMTVEAGFKGELDKAPIGIAADGSNEYARSEEGSTFATHAHVEILFAEHFTPAFHLIRSWSQDDRGDPEDNPSTDTNEAQTHKDGSLLILGGDLRIDGERFGYLYLGGAHVKGQNTNSMSDMVQVLNTGSGYFLNERYWGFASDGNGTLTLAGLQYGISLGTLLRHPMPYWGVGPDLIINVFGIYGYSSSDAEEIGDRHMLKYGAEGVYSFSRYAAAALRLDHVMPNPDSQSTSFGVISPKIIIRSGWNARESIILQYSYIAAGDDVVVRGDNRLMAASDKADRHMLALYGTIWW